MAYPISNSVLDLFKSQLRQVADITMYGTEETKHLSENDVVQGGLTVDRYCVSGSRIEIGSAVAAEMTLTLNNNDGRFDDTVFEGAELFVRIGIKKWEAHRWENAVIEYIPLGYFTVDNSPRKLASISLTALDRMVLFDKPCKPEDIRFPVTIEDLLVTICSKCNVLLAINPANLTNSQYMVDEFPEGDSHTYRQILMWIAEITGTCAYIDWNGQLRLEWYGENSSEVLSPNMRYTSDLNDKPITITGVQITVSDEEVYLQGTEDYAFNIESNGLLQENVAVVATSLYEKLGGFSYTPYSCIAKPLVHLYPLDRVKFIDKKGNEVSSIVTNTTFTINSNLELAGQGETETTNGYAKANPLTKQESAIINSVKKDLGKELASKEQILIGLNESIINSLGLYFSEEVLEDGSTVYYYHDQTTKEQSNIVYTFRAGGFAWTDKWDGDETVWKSGVDRNGNAVLNILSAFQITADHIQAGSISSDRLNVDFEKTIVTTSALVESLQTIRQDFTAADGALESVISQKTAQTYATKSSVESAITQSAKDVEISVSEKISDTLFSNSFIRETPPTMENTNEFERQKLCFCESDESYYRFNTLSQQWSKVDSSSIWSSFKLTSDGFELNADVVKIKADMINEGTLKTDNLTISNENGSSILTSKMFKMTSNDNSVICISTEDTSDYSKGLTIIESYNEDGTPKNYSIYNADGQKRYVNNHKVATYTVCATGSAVGYKDERDYSHVYLPCVGNYFYEWATLYNTESESNQRMMLNIVVSNETEVTTSYNYRNIAANYDFVEVIPVKKGDELEYFTSDIDGAYIRYQGRFSYLIQTGETRWETKYQNLKLSFLAVTTMDI